MYSDRHERDWPPENRKPVQFVLPSEAPLQPAQKAVPLRPKAHVARPKAQITATLVQRKSSTRNVNAHANFLFLALKMLFGAVLGFVLLGCGWVIGTVLSAL